MDWFGSARSWPLLVSPLVGSFLGVLIIRLPGGVPVAIARSACAHCGTRLRALDLVPLVSFLVFRGRCRHCRAPLGLYYPAVELAAAAVALWAVLVDDDLDRTWVDCGLGWTLLALAWIDWRNFLLPDVLTLSLVLAGLGATLTFDPDALTDHCLATILGYLSFRGLAAVYRRLRGWEGLGGGDAKLIAGAGAWCGLAAFPLIVLGSALLGLLAALGLALTGRSMTSTTRIPFGPFIALAFWVMRMHGALVENLFRLLGRV
jgi:leader peptidase (prepilin peptidase)/N-methyltransferase